MLPATRLTIHIRTPNPETSQVSEGEVPLADQQALQLKQMIGDGKAEVTVGRDMAAKDFGQGGGVFVTVKLTCDQDPQWVDYAIRCAGTIAEKHLQEQFSLHMALLQNQGLIK